MKLLFLALSLLTSLSLQAEALKSGDYFLYKNGSNSNYILDRAQDVTPNGDAMTSNGKKISNSKVVPATGCADSGYCIACEVVTTNEFLKELPVHSLIYGIVDRNTVVVDERSPTGRLAFLVARQINSLVFVKKPNPQLHYPERGRDPRQWRGQIMGDGFFGSGVDDQYRAVQSASAL